MGGGREGLLGNRIHNIYIYIFFVVSLAGREPQCQVDSEGENDRADDANRRALGVDGNRREGAGGEGDDGDDDEACVTGSIFISKEISSGEPAAKGGMVERARRKECVKVLA